jgi:hypothetical protein
MEQRVLADNESGERQSCVGVLVMPTLLQAEIIIIAGLGVIAVLSVLAIVARRHM